jgi:hypothetical protein
MGVMINNTRISNNLAKIISLSMVGLSYKKIDEVLTITEQVIRNEVSQAYGQLATERCINALLYLAYTHGFTYDLQVNGVVVLADYELIRLKKHVPRLIPIIQLAQQVNRWNPDNCQ